MRRSSSFLASWIGSYLVFKTAFEEFFMGRPMLPPTDTATTISFALAIILGALAAWMITKPEKTKVTAK